MKGRFDMINSRQAYHALLVRLQCLRNSTTAFCFINLDIVLTATLCLSNSS